MNRTVQMLNYLPPFMQEYVEMIEIMNSENDIFQEVEDQREASLNNQFIKTCDETGIAKFEELYGVTSDTDATLETRKTNVILKLNNELPYSRKWLENFLNTVFGENNYTLSIDNEGYTIHIETLLTYSASAESIKQDLKNTIPANMILEYDFNTSIRSYFAATVMEAYEDMTIDAVANEHTETIDFDTENYIGFGIEENENNNIGGY